MSETRYHLVHNGRFVGTVNERTYLVPEDAPGKVITIPQLLDPTEWGLSVIPLLEHLEFPESIDDEVTPQVRIQTVANHAGVDVDDLISKYAERLQDIYDCQTAGAHTFTGVLATFLMELEGR